MECEQAVEGGASFNKLWIFHRSILVYSYTSQFTFGLETDAVQTPKQLEKVCSTEGNHCDNMAIVCIHVKLSEFLP